MKLSDGQVPIQIIPQGFILSSTGCIYHFDSGNNVLWSVHIPCARCMCACGDQVFVCCSSGKVYQVNYKGHFSEILDLKYNLSCISADESSYVVGCDDVAHGSLILVVDRLSLSVKELTDGHLGDISQVRLAKGMLYSAGVDGLLCKYLDFELDQCFNVGASIMSFDVRKAKLVCCTDIHTAILIEGDKMLHFKRPSDQLFAVDVFCRREGAFAVMTDDSGRLSVYRLSTLGKMKLLCSAHLHDSFVQCACASDLALLAVDDNMNVKCVEGWNK